MYAFFSLTVFHNNVLCLKVLNSHTQKTAFPGEVFSLGIEALDEIQQQTSAVIRISDADDIVRDSLKQ